jgi:hypothetical protein
MRRPWPIGVGHTKRKINANRSPEDHRTVISKNALCCNRCASNSAQRNVCRRQKHACSRLSVVVLCSFRVRSFVCVMSLTPIAQWSLYVPHSGHYMYRTAVTICTAQQSLYVPPSGHYMYRPVVTICTAQQSLYVPPSGHYMYHSLTFTILRSAHTLCLCVLCGSQNKQPLYTYTTLSDWFV